MSAIVQLKSQPLLLQGQGDLQVIYKNKEPCWRHELLLDLRYSAVPTLVSAPDWCFTWAGGCGVSDSRQLL